MASQIVKGFMWKASGDTLEFCGENMDMSSEGWILVGPHDTVFEIPEDFNPVAAELAQLNKQLDVMADKYHKQTARVRERIANLLCIEHTPASSDPDFDEVGAP